MGILDLGGGLAISYDGLKSNEASSSDYGMKEYCADVVEAISIIADEAGVEHPDIISESGRAVVAYYSVLVMNVLDINRFESPGIKKLPKKSPPLLKNFFHLRERIRNNGEKLTGEYLQEIYNDALYYREKIRTEFSSGKVTLRQRSTGEELYWEVLAWVAEQVKDGGFSSEQMEKLSAVLTDIYYANFSVFQSLPDFWAINQLFPLMPIHRLKEQPTRPVVISDITCDCDGKMDRFVHSRETHTSLPLHDIRVEDEYMLGIFLVGAYQETLGDLHNLLGDTNVVSVKLENGRLKYVRELEGDTVAEVLDYVEYEPKELIRRFRVLAEEAVVKKRISARERHSIMEAYEEGMRGYTYFES
jgi:arginine decarboxylase